LDRHAAVLTARDDRREILAGQVLHADEVVPVDLAQLVGGDDVRMLQPRRDPRFIEEHLAQLFAIRQMRLDALQRDDLHEALYSAPLGDVQPAHAALTEQAEQLVAAARFSEASGHLRRVHRMSALDHAETLSSLCACWFRANNTCVLRLPFSSRVVVATTTGGN